MEERRRSKGGGRTKKEKNPGVTGGVGGKDFKLVVVAGSVGDRIRMKQGMA